jgi:hypothetical protein
MLIIAGTPERPDYHELLYIQRSSPVKIAANGVDEHEHEGCYAVLPLATHSAVLSIVNL